MLREKLCGYLRGNVHKLCEVLGLGSYILSSGHGPYSPASVEFQKPCSFQHSKADSEPKFRWHLWAFLIECIHVAISGESLPRSLLLPDNDFSCL